MPDRHAHSPYLSVECRVGTHDQCKVPERAGTRPTPGVVYETCNCRCHQANDSRRLAMRGN
ncbi:hypothetical protein [Streptomyces luteireticuli]|uniref:hypothetical protein n=1 Tax=Streptomyces luteireticuli TaxID=173858 RepID=UPI0035579B2D